ncbi:MAG: hypothetical protein U9P90_02745 [Patescibacteria group bacterium]|nr:hypothetical protein [Patescibacteria group bacterium]
MKHIVVVLVCLSVLSFTFTSFAEEASAPFVSQGGFEMSLVSGAGVNLKDLENCSVFWALRLSYLPRVPFALELNAVLPFGVGANLLIYAYRDDIVRVHLIDPGIFYSWFSDISAEWMSRELDITMGAGIEVRVHPRLFVTLDWRVFLPNPAEVAPKYAEWGLLSYEEAAWGGELWIGASYIL